MAVTVDDCLAAIEHHTRGLAAAAGGNLDARVEHCPEWSVADLVHHLTEVHGFWNHVAATRPTEPPQDRPEPARVPDAELIPTLLAGMETLVATLRAADQQAPCWTWGLEENVWFITRHQVQEAAVHHWDAANATGHDWFIDADVALDAVDEFLTHSVANLRWPNPAAASLGGTIWFCPCFSDSERRPSWHITDGDIPGTLAVSSYEGRSPDIDGPADGDHVNAGQLLLWLYRRHTDEQINSGSAPSGTARPLYERFRAFTNTD